MGLLSEIFVDSEVWDAVGRTRVLAADKPALKGAAMREA